MSFRVHSSSSNGFQLYITIYIWWSMCGRRSDLLQHYHRRPTVTLVYPHRFLFLVRHRECGATFGISWFFGIFYALSRGHECLPSILSIASAKSRRIFLISNEWRRNRIVFSEYKDFSAILFWFARAKRKRKNRSTYQRYTYLYVYIYIYGVENAGEHCVVDASNDQANANGFQLQIKINVCNAIACCTYQRNG